MLVGIDIGTSAVKAVVVDPSNGAVLGVGAGGVPMQTPRAGWTEQEPRDWWRASVRAVHEAIEASGRAGSEVRGIGLSGQMHGSVFLSGEALARGGTEVETIRPALLWNDQRTKDQLADVERAAGGTRALVARTGNSATTGFQLPKILWLRTHEPEAFARVRAVLLPKDYIRFCLSGERATDAGDASGTLLLDVNTRDWHRASMAAHGLDAAWFPRVVESGAVAGTLSREAAAALGLRAGIPIAGGSGDNQCGAIGAGVVEPGLALAILGTSGVIYAHSIAPRPDLMLPDGPHGRTHAMCAGDGSGAARGEWCVTGVMLSAAGSLQWARDALFPEASLDVLLREAWSVAAGSEGLVFLPSLQGERMAPDARGAWAGLSLRHTRGHLVRSVIEGVSFAMAGILDLVRSLGVPVSAVRVGGGGGKSREWRQLLADLFDVPVEVPTTEEGGAYGAALLGGVAAGTWKDVRSAARACVRCTDRTMPTGAGGTYAEHRAIFAGLSSALGPTFGRLARTGGRT